MLRLFLSCALLLCITTASAQTIVINPDKNRMPTAAMAGVEPVRVSLSISMFIPASEDDSAQALRAQEDGRKMVYEAAAHECDLLRATIASDCRLESININVQHMPANPNFNPNFGQRAGYNINGSMNYRIGVK
jgi:hypothetical protein